MADKNMYLTDLQYQSLVQKMLEAVSKPGFKPTCKDSTTVGNKYTVSNCGLCNDDWTTEEIAMFPDDFRKNNRTDMRYRKEYHHCPFDWRGRPKWNGSEALDGCLYTCKLFKKKYRHIQEMTTDIMDTLKWISNHIKENT